MNDRCGVCGGTSFVSVKGKEALAAFPSGKRCANFFGHHLRRERLRGLCLAEYTVIIADAPFGIGSIELKCQKLINHGGDDAKHYGLGSARFESNETLVEITETRSW